MSDTREIRADEFADELRLQGEVICELLALLPSPVQASLGDTAFEAEQAMQAAAVEVAGMNLRGALATEVPQAVWGWIAASRLFGAHRRMGLVVDLAAARWNLTWSYEAAWQVLSRLTGKRPPRNRYFSA